MIFIDTNVFMYALGSHHSLQEAARQFSGNRIKPIPNYSRRLKSSRNCFMSIFAPDGCMILTRHLI